MFTWIKNLFIKRKIKVSSEPIVEFNNNLIQHPYVTIIVGKQKLYITSGQARRLWGKLGSELDRLTPGGVKNFSEDKK